MLVVSLLFQDKSHWPDRAERQQSRGSPTACCAEKEKEVSSSDGKTLLLG